MSRICTVCARGGSEGVKNKNVRLLDGVPLIAHSLKQARASGLFDVIAVSSDSKEIISVALAHGADTAVERPPDLATSSAPKLPAIRHCVQNVEERQGRYFDVVVDLDATSPLRVVDDIRGAVALLEGKTISNVITGATARRSPYFNLVELDAHGVARLSKQPITPVLRRQDAPQCFDMNASIYVWTRDAIFGGSSLFLHDTELFVMPEERSIDIDSELDFEIVEFLMRRRSRHG